MHIDGLAEQASQAVLDRKDELAKAITEEIFVRHPEYDAKFGEIGRPKTLQDMGHTLDFLAPAVALSDPSMFARYVTWLVEVLKPRGVSPIVVRESLEVFRDVVSARLPIDYQTAVAPIIDAGLRVVANENHG